MNYVTMITWFTSRVQPYYDFLSQFFFSYKKKHVAKHQRKKNTYCKKELYMNNLILSKEIVNLMQKTPKHT